MLPSRAWKNLRSKRSLCSCVEWSASSRRWISSRARPAPQHSGPGRLGVYQGSSTKFLVGIFPKEAIHGFDSFEGLPGDWTHALKGTFGEVKGVLPDMPANVKLYKGWFEDTLPVWLEGHRDRPISLLRVDCDIYSSTRTIFDTMKPLIRSGTWIVFDELTDTGVGARTSIAPSRSSSPKPASYDYASFRLTYVILHLK